MPKRYGIRGFPLLKSPLGHFEPGLVFPILFPAGVDWIKENWELLELN